MATHRQAQETIDRCVSVMDRYHHAERTRHATIQMITEVQDIAAWVFELGLGTDETDERIVRLVRDELIERYGHELGSRLTIDFLKAFDSIAADEPGTLVFEGLYGTL